MDLDTPTSRTIIFGILSALTIPSVICSLVILYYFARSPELLKRHNNHVILALLLISLIQVSHEQLMLKKIFSFWRWPRKCHSLWLCCIRDLWLYNQIFFVTFGLYTIMHYLLMVWCSWVMDVSNDTFLYFVESFSKSIWFYFTTDR